MARSCPLASAGRGARDERPGLGPRARAARGWWCSSSALRCAPRAVPSQPGSAERDELEVARESKYREIRDAELDYRTGKLSREDYEAVDGALRAEAVEILNRLDAPRSGQIADERTAAGGGEAGVKAAGDTDDAADDV